MDEIAAAISDKGVASELLRPGISSIDSDSSGAGEVSGRPSAAFDRSRHQPGHAPLGANDAPRLIRTDAVNFGGRSIDCDINRRWRHRKVRVARRVSIFVHD